MHKNLRRGVVAMATTLVCLIMVAQPASASVVTGAVTAGTLTLINATGTATDTLAFGGTGTGGTDCANSASVTLTPTGAVTSWSITALSIVGRAKVNATWYVVTYLRDGDTYGNVGVTGGTTTTSTLLQVVMDFEINVYIATDQTETGTSCSHGTTRTCRFATASATISGVYTGDINSPTTGHTITLSSSAGTMGSTTPPCNAPFTTYNNGTLSITGLTIPVV